MGVIFSAARPSARVSISPFIGNHTSCPDDMFASTEGSSSNFEQVLFIAKGRVVTLNQGHFFFILSESYLLLLWPYLLFLSRGIL